MCSPQGIHDAHSDIFPLKSPKTTPPRCCVVTSQAQKQKPPSVKVIIFRVMLYVRRCNSTDSQALRILPIRHGNNSPLFANSPSFVWPTKSAAPPVRARQICNVIVWLSLWGTIMEKEAITNTIRHTNVDLTFVINIIKAWRDVMVVNSCSCYNLFLLCIY